MRFPGPERVVGRRLATIRRARNLSQGELAARLRALGITVHTTMVSKVEQKQRDVAVHELVAFAVALNCTPMALVLPLADDIGESVMLAPQCSVDTGDAWSWALGQSPLVVPPKHLDWYGEELPARVREYEAQLPPVIRRARSEPLFAALTELIGKVEVAINLREHDRTPEGRERAVEELRYWVRRLDFEIDEFARRGREGAV